jgi:acyl-CoA thioesterase
MRKRRVDLSFLKARWPTDTVARTEMANFTDGAISRKMMDNTVKEAIFGKVEKEPFAQKFGIKLLDLNDGYSKVEMKFTPDMQNILGMAHGGALFALIDEAFETASNSHGTVAVALNMNVTYISSPALGSRLTAEAREFSQTHRTANYEIKVLDDRKNLIASCQALVYRKGEPLPFLND